ncbi:hypothetical protein COO60DRAFT_813345 [Scenedesmus sp. NREL 46B-D3]|nr:hypothetical protein COO60DRAFT_813345 [Scenedesmus sp. NREL 46B-D3]
MHILAASQAMVPQGLSPAWGQPQPNALRDAALQPQCRSLSAAAAVEAAQQVAPLPWHVASRSCKRSLLLGPRLHSSGAQHAHGDCCTHVLLGRHAPWQLLLPLRQDSMLLALLPRCLARLCALTARARQRRVAKRLVACSLIADAHSSEQEPCPVFGCR